MTSATYTGIEGFTADEAIFVRRMLPHFMAGKTAAEAAAAVLEDDARLFSAFSERRHSQYVPTADECGRSYETRFGKGDVLAAEITSTVYSALRSAA